MTKNSKPKVVLTSCGTLVVRVGLQEPADRLAAPEPNNPLIAARIIRQDISNQRMPGIEIKREILSVNCYILCF